MPEFKPDATPIAFTLRDCGDDMTPAEALEVRLQATLSQLDEIAAEIERTGPDYVVRRGRNIGRAGVLHSFEKALTTLGCAETYLHQHAENARRGSA